MVQPRLAQPRIGVVVTALNTHLQSVAAGLAGVVVTDEPSLVPQEQAFSVPALHRAMIVGVAVPLADDIHADVENVVLEEVMKFCWIRSLLAVEVHLSIVNVVSGAMAASVTHVGVPVVIAQGTCTALPTHEVCDWSAVFVPAAQISAPVVLIARVFVAQVWRAGWLILARTLAWSAATEDSDQGVVENHSSMICPTALVDAPNPVRPPRTQTSTLLATFAPPIVAVAVVPPFSLA